MSRKNTEGKEDKEEKEDNSIEEQSYVQQIFVGGDMSPMT